MPVCNQELEVVEKSNGVMTNGDSVHVTKGLTNGTVRTSNGFDHVAACKVSRDGVYGRHLVATHDLVVGDVVMQEAPLVTGPPVTSTPCCVACYQASRRPCRRGCGWPVCGDECAESDAHEAECEMTRKYRGEEVSLDDWEQLRDTLIVLRCLWCRASNPTVWEKLWELESHTEKRIQTGKYEKDRVTVVHFLRRYFKLEEHFTEEEILKICGVIQINGYGVRLTSPSYTAVYDVLSFIEHHCTPNCVKSWSSTGVLTVRACVPVLDGEHLSISYTEPLCGTAARRHHLSGELLACRCERCTDPSEHGTNYSAVLCQDNSCNGYLLPDDPLATDALTTHAGASPWRCNTCHVTTSAARVSAMLSSLHVHKMAAAERADEAAWRKFIALAESSLHVNHFWMTEARLELVQMIGKGKGGMQAISDGEVKEKMRLCRELIALADVLFAAVPRVSGVLRYELQRTLVEDARRRSKLEPGACALQLAESRELLRDAASILLYEPDTLPEGKIGRVVRRQLEAVEVPS